MNTYGRKIFACFLTIMMICSSLALINTASAQEPVEAPMEVDNPVPDIQVTELRASEPVIYADLNNRLTLSVANYGSANAIKVVADVIDIKPDMSEELIKTLHFGALIVDVERTRFIDWCPEELGTHYVKININYEYLSHHSPAELIENPPVILSVGFPVSPLVDIEYWGPDPWDDASNIITSAEGTRTVDGLIEIRVRNGDLQIETGASLILNQDVTLVMIEPDRGVYDIIVDQDATFEINGGATKTTKLQSSDWQFTYAFFNNGTVDFTGATVWYTYGDKTALNNPGGIQNLPGSTCIIDNCDLLEADTHSLSIEGTADVHVKGVGTTIGRLSGEENPNVVQGHGIFVKEATPVIEYVTVQYNKMDGIHIEDSASEGAPLATCMKYYSSSSYDYRLTDDPDTSTQPIVAAGNGAVYMVYLNQESDIIYFKKSIDKGASWSAPEIVIDSGYPISDIDFAADGDNLALVWVEWPHMFPRTYMVFSEFGGASWTAPPYLLEGAAFCGSSTPAVDVQGSDVFIVYMHWAATGPDFYLTMRVTWSEGIGFEEIIFRSPITGSEFAGIPDIAVEGSDIHVVIADTDSRWPYIYYWQSGDGGISWSDSEPIATYDGSMLPGYISMEATADRVYFAWATYDGGVGNYEIYGMYAYYDGMDWIWSSDIIISQETIDLGDSIYPSVTIDSQDNWYVAWQDDRDGTNRIRYSCLDSSGAIVVSDTLLTPDTTGAYLPSISIDSTDHAYLVWEDERDVGNSEVYIKRAPQLVVCGVSLIENKENSMSIENSNAIIIGNNIYGGESSICGINVDNGGKTWIIGNIIEESELGIFSTDSEPTIESNIISNILKGIHIEGTLVPLTTATVIGNYIYCTGDGGYGIYTGSGTTKIEDNEIIFAGYLSYSRGIGICVGVFPPLTPETLPLDAESISINNNVIRDFDSGLILGGTASTIVLSGNIISSNLGHGMTLFKASAPLFDVTANDIYGNQGWGIYLQDSTPNNLDFLYDVNNCGCNRLGNVICQWSVEISTAPIESTIQLIEPDNTEVLSTTTVSGQIGPIFITEFHVGADGLISTHTPHIIRTKPIYEEKLIPPSETFITIDQPDILYLPAYSTVDETFDYNLIQGINYVSLPLVNDALVTAENLAGLIGIADVESISLSDPSGGPPDIYYPGTPGSDFSLVPGVHYEISIIPIGGASFTLQGYRTGWINLDVYPTNINDIGWIGYDNIWASDFANIAPSFVEVGYYDGISWQYYDGISGDFLMEPGKGYRLYSQGGILEYSEGELDLDDDGLSYAEEVFVYNTDHFDPTTDWDTDTDGINDWWEAQYYHDGTGTLPNVDDAGDDLDLDSLINSIEYQLNTFPNYYDTDKDGIPDGSEDSNHDGIIAPDETNPAEYDTDGDGMGDYYEVKCKDAGGLWDPTIYDERYAVLFVGGIDFEENRASYWNQLVQMYDTLTEDYGYEEENVFVFYADGNTPIEFNCREYMNAIEVETHKDIIDFPAEYEIAKEFFTVELNGIIDSGNEFLYVWTYDHGGGVDGSPDATLWCWHKQEITDNEFASWFKAYDFRRIAFTMGQCFSGGFIDDIMTLRAGIPPPLREVIISTSVYLTGSNSDTTKGYLYHHWLAIRPCSGDLGAGNANYAKGRFIPEYTADVDGNNVVSLDEAFVYAEANDDFGLNGSGELFPQYDESIDDLGSVTFL